MPAELSTAEAEALKRVGLEQIERGVTYLLNHPQVPSEMKMEIERIAALARTAVFEQDAEKGQAVLQMLADLQEESKRLGLALDVDVPEA